KASIVDAATGESVATSQSPSEEMEILSPQTGWAEQDPAMWWQHAMLSVRSAMKKTSATATEISAIGISYQMHGLVVVDRDQNVLRPSIIWCDSRAVRVGEDACRALGQDYCLEHFLNSP